MINLRGVDVRGVGVLVAWSTSRTWRIDLCWRNKE